MLGVTTVMAQDNPYIVKTKGVKKTVAMTVTNGQQEEEEEEEEDATDFMGKNFRFYSMCDWQTVR